MAGLQHCFGCYEMLGIPPEEEVAEHDPSLPVPETQQPKGSPIKLAGVDVNPVVLVGAAVVAYFLMRK